MGVYERIVNVGENKIVIRRPRNIEEYSMLVEVERKVWGLKDYYLAVPAHIMKAVDSHGGLALGAFLDDKEAIGMLFGVLGEYEGKIVHYSHLAGVIGEHRFKGIGFEMKLAQRDYVMSKGIDLVVWTYDPAQGPNAKFNISKLGAIVRKFHEDYYGRLDDEINRGMPTDRFEAEWWVCSRRVKLKLSGKLPSRSLEYYLNKKPHIPITTTISGDCRILKDLTIEGDDESPLVLVEIPGDINTLRAKCPEELMKWRMALRKVFQKYLNGDYIVVDFVSEKMHGERRNFYVLWKRDLNSVLSGEMP